MLAVAKSKRGVESRFQASVVPLGGGVAAYEPIPGKSPTFCTHRHPRYRRYPPGHARATPLATPQSERPRRRSRPCRRALRTPATPRTPRALRAYGALRPTSRPSRRPDDNGRPSITPCSVRRCDRPAAPHGDSAAARRPPPSDPWAPLLRHPRPSSQHRPTAPGPPPPSCARTRPPPASSRARTYRPEPYRARRPDPGASYRRRRHHSPRRRPTQRNDTLHLSTPPPWPDCPASPAPPRPPRTARDTRPASPPPHPAPPQPRAPPAPASGCMTIRATSPQTLARQEKSDHQFPVASGCYAAELRHHAPAAPLAHQAPVSALAAHHRPP